MKKRPVASKGGTQHRQGIVGSQATGREGRRSGADKGLETVKERASLALGPSGNGGIMLRIRLR